MGEEQNEQRRVENNSFEMVKMTLEEIIIESKKFRYTEKQKINIFHSFHNTKRISRSSSLLNSIKKKISGYNSYLFLNINFK